MGVASILGYAANDEPDSGSRLLMIEAANELEEGPLIIRDATTGRLSIGGVEMGNTGWRNLSIADLGSPVNLSAVQVYYKRSGQTVTARIGLFSTGASWVDNDSADNNITIPSGFQPYRGGVVGAARNGVSGAQTFVFAVDTVPSALLRVGRINLAANQTVQSVTVSWITSDAWPVSLPGAQSTAPITG